MNEIGDNFKSRQLNSTGTAEEANAVSENMSALDPKILIANGLVVTTSGTLPGKSKTSHHIKHTKSRIVKVSRYNHTGDSGVHPNFCQAVKGALQSKLGSLTELRRQAEAEIPRPPDVLSMALRMPLVQKCFRVISRRKRTSELRRCFCVWYNRIVLEYHDALELRKELSAILIQRKWRGFIIRLMMWRREQYAAKKMVSAVSVVRRLCKVYRLRKAVRIRIEEKQQAKVYPMAAIIQSIVRSMLGRRAFLRTARRELYRELRLWSGGRVDRLLRRPGLQDLETQYLLLSAVGLATDSLKDSIAKHGLRLRLVILKYLRIVRERREKSESAEEILKVESVQRALDQAAMRSEDKLAVLVLRFDYETHAREQRRAQKRLEELERHRAETAASSERRADQLKASLRIQEARLEKRERELMYFCEFAQRAVEWKIKDIENKGLAHEIVQMIKEDQLSHSIATAEKDLAEKSRIARCQLDKVVEAKLEGIRLNGGDGSKYGRSMVERNFAEKEYNRDGHYDSISLLSGTMISGFNSISKSERIGLIFHEMKSQLTASLRMVCSVRRSKEDETERRILLRGSVVTESRYSFLFSKLDALSRVRDTRRNDYRYLSEALAYFNRDLSRLGQLRHLNRTVKFESKKARQDILKEAILLERRLSKIQSDAEKYGTALVSVIKEEAEIFNYLFFHGGPKEFVFAHSPQLFNLKVQTAVSKVSGSWLQQKKTNNVITRRATKVDIRSPSSKNSSGVSNQKLLDNEPESWFHETEEFLKSSTEIDDIDRSYYTSVGTLELSSRPPPEMKLPKDKAGEAKTKTSNIPGLSKFLDNDSISYEFYVWAIEVLHWVKDTVMQMRQYELIWRQHYRNQLISFYQRMNYVSNTEYTLSTTSSAAVLSPHDVSAPRAIDRADTIELYQLLCCRASIKLTGLDVLSNQVVELQLSSRECEQRFGMHPFSSAGRLLYLEQLFGLEKHSSVGSVSDVSTEPGDRKGFREKVDENVRYNHIRDQKCHLFDSFDEPKLISHALRNEFSGLKLLVMELNGHGFLNLSSASPNAIDSRNDDKPLTACSYRKQSSSKIKTDANVGLYLTLNKEANINSFIKTTITNEDFDIHLMPWMCPIHHWGSSAEPEPVWRRIGITDVIKMTRTFLKENAVKDPITKIMPKAASSKSMPRKRELSYALARRKVQSGPLNDKKERKQTKSLIGIAKRVATKKIQRAKRETRLDDFEAKVKRWGQNILHHLQDRVKEKRALIARVAEVEREKRFRTLESDRMHWEDALAHLVAIDQKFMTGKLSRDPPPEPSASCFPFLFTKKYAKITADHENFLSISQEIHEHCQVLNRVPDAKVYTDLRHKIFTEDELNIRKQLRSQRTRTRSMSSDSRQESTNHLTRKMSAISKLESNSKMTKKISAHKLSLIKRIADQKKRVKSPVVFTKKHELVTASIKIHRPFVSFAEVWVCGGPSAVIVACRIVFDTRRNPRGELRTMVFSGKESPLLCARCGFVTRKLCSDRSDAFAVTRSGRGKYLCDKTLRYFRGTDYPVRELPTLDTYCRDICELFFKKQDEKILGDSQLMRALLMFQLMCRAKVLKWSLRKRTSQ